jgi:hypothetical protein
MATRAQYALKRVSLEKAPERFGWIFLAQYGGVKLGPGNYTFRKFMGNEE